VTEGSLTGGQLARLDELADLTREHAKLGRVLEQALCLLACAPWLGFAEAVFGRDTAWGRATCAAGALVSVLIWAVIRRFPLLPAVAYRPADEVERRALRRQRWFVGVQAAPYVVLLISAMAVDALEYEAGAPPGAVAARWVTWGLFLAAAVLIIVRRWWDAAFLPVIFLMLGSVAADASSTSDEARRIMAAFHFVIAAAAPALGAAGLAMLVWAQRRRARLDGRLALLKEHAG
jgi:hypothetical protein